MDGLIMDHMDLVVFTTLGMVVASELDGVGTVGVGTVGAQVGIDGPGMLIVLIIMETTADIITVDVMPIILLEDIIHLVEGIHQQET